MSVPLSQVVSAVVRPLTILNLMSSFEAPVYLKIVTATRLIQTSELKTLFGPCCLVFTCIKPVAQPVADPT